MSKTKFSKFFLPIKICELKSKKKKISGYCNSKTQHRDRKYTIIDCHLCKHKREKVNWDRDFLSFDRERENISYSIGYNSLLRETKN